MALTANRCARLLNQSDLARDAGLPQATVHRHLNLLETGCLLARLSVYTTNPITGLVKSKKIFWRDSCLAAWLAGIKSAQSLTNRLDQGYWLEQAIFQSLQCWCGLDPGNRRICFWRDRSGHEVDFVLEKDGNLVAIEVKASHQVTPADTEGLAAFRRSLGRAARFRRGVVLHAGEARTLGQEFVALPWVWLMPAE